VPHILTVVPGTAVSLDDHDPGTKLGLADKVEGKAQHDELLEQLSTYQSLLWAEKQRSLLLILQGMDGAGKDSTIRRVFAGLNPQGCRVVSFARPDRSELERDYLWRIHQVTPVAGEIGIFNRSHYEDVVTVRVQNLVDEIRWRPRFRHIREFERMLVEEGTTIVKVFLNISREEQRQRLQKRIDDPAKRWKFDPADLTARERWGHHRRAYEEAISETTTDHAPWHIVPGDHKWVRDVAVTRLLVEALRKLDPEPPAGPDNLDGLVIT
jgi:PPK2 family polyphosphate:nucleotide phosphotransferase